MATIQERIDKLRQTSADNSAYDIESRLNALRTGVQNRREAEPTSFEASSPVDSLWQRGSNAPVKSNYTLPADSSGRFSSGQRGGNTGKFDLGKFLIGEAERSVNAVAKQGGATAAFLEKNVVAPVLDVFLPGAAENATVFQDWNAAIDRESEQTNKRYGSNIAAGGKAAGVADTLITGTAGAIPAAVVAIASAGGSQALEATSRMAQAAPGVFSALKISGEQMLKNPSYWTSFFTTLGNDYEQAKADGADDTRATLYALANSTLGAAVEVGGGIETLPKEVANGRFTLKQWIDTMLDEGKEEVVQGVISRALQNAAYQKGNPTFSTENTDAIFNPATMAKEGATGAAIGGIMGGAQGLTMNAINSAAKRADARAPGVMEQEAARLFAQESEKPAQNPLQTGVDAQQTVPASVDTSAENAALNEPQAVNPAEAAQAEPDALLTALLGNGKRVPHETLTNEQFEAASAIQERDGSIAMDAQNRVYQVDPEQHIDQRTYESVADRNVNAFQFDHPELHDAYVESAQSLMADADESIMFPTSRRKERGAQGNRFIQSIAESKPLRFAMDEGLTRNQIIKAAQDLIANHGQENYAAAKRLEFVLDDMLTNGWTDIHGNYNPPNQDYINAKNAIFGAQTEAAPEVELPFSVRDDGLGNANRGSVNTPFDTMQAQSDSFHNVNAQAAENTAEMRGRAPSEVPKTNPETGKDITKTVSTILNSPLTSNEMAPIIEQSVADGKFDYVPVTDDAANKAAQARLGRDGVKGIATDFLFKVDAGQLITKQDMADAIAAYNQAVESGDFATAFDLMAGISNAAHTSAQVTQSMNMLNRLTPEGKLLTLRRFVDRFNSKNQGKKAARQSTIDTETARTNYVEERTGMGISDELAANYLMAETDEARAQAWNAIIKDLADQIPPTFKERVDAWRYFSMLSNPTTHGRNFIGNAIQAVARIIKDAVGAIIEPAVIKDRSKRTKSIYNPFSEAGKALRSFAREQYAADQKAAMGTGRYDTGSTYGIEREIMDMRKPFLGKNWLSKVVQGAMDLNAAALDAEDVLFNRAAYIDAFAKALKAKGITAEQARAGGEAVEAARAVAIREAQKATYRNTTALSEALSKIGNYKGDNKALKVGSFAIDALLPFRRTPANILGTGIDYSPVGLLKAITYDAAQVHSGKITAADMVDHLSAGLTGTGVLLLGMYLASEGILKAQTGESDKEKAFNKDRGEQKYSLQIGDQSYTLDWMSPSAMPLFAGVSIMENAKQNNDPFSILADAIIGASDVAIETSMLSSFNDFLSNISYADNIPIYMIDRTLSSYAGQFVPTVGGKIASAVDDTVRKSYSEKGTGQVKSDVNYFLQSQLKKVPGARETLQPSVDLWGNEVSNGEVSKRIVQAFVSPGSLKTVRNTPVDQEIARLAEAVGSSVYPTAAEKSFQVDGSAKNLTASEYTAYAKDLGKTRYDLLAEAIQGGAYQGMTDEEKADYVKRVYDYSGKLARFNAGGKTPDLWVENAKNAEHDIGVSTADWLALYEKYGAGIMSGDAYEKTKAAVKLGLTVDQYAAMKVGIDLDGNDSVSQKEAQAYLDSQGFKKSQKIDLWTIINSGWKTNPYT